MSNWEDIIKFFEERSTFHREGQMWDDLRLHCKVTLRLIPEIRNHVQLQSLEPFINVNHLHLLNRTDGIIAHVTNFDDNITEITHYNVGEGLEFDKHIQIKVATDEVVDVLLKIMFSEVNSS